MSWLSIIFISAPFIIIIFYLIGLILDIENPFPFPRDKTSTPRFHVVYRSPRFGTCWHGYVCDICDGKRVSKHSYVLGEARQIQRAICMRDTLALTYLEKAE